MGDNMYCSKCGSELKENASFCSNCGIPVNGKKRFPVWIPIAIVVAIVIVIVAGVTIYSNSPSQRFKEQISLGERYLSDLKYDEAISAFTAALEIDPKNKEAKKGLTQSSLELAKELIEDGNTKEARRILKDAYDLTDDQKLADRIEELEEPTEDDYDVVMNKIMESAERSDSRMEISIAPDEDGIEWWFIYDYSDGYRLKLSELMDAAEKQSQKNEFRDFVTYEQPKEDPLINDVFALSYDIGGDEIYCWYLYDYTNCNRVKLKDLIRVAKDCRVELFLLDQNIESE